MQAEHFGLLTDVDVGLPFTIMGSVHVVSLL